MVGESRVLNGPVPNVGVLNVHGYAGYKAGCRCGQCRRANLEHYRRWKARVSSAARMPREHGTRASYQNYDCRCAECTDANRRYQREWLRAARRMAVRGEAVAASVRGESQSSVAASVESSVAAVDNPEGSG